MFLFDIFSFNAENVEAVNVARRMTHGIRVTLMGSPGMITDFDVFIAMTWSFVSKILIRDVKRLEAKGDMLGEWAYGRYLLQINLEPKLFCMRSLSPTSLPLPPIPILPYPDLLPQLASQVGPVTVRSHAQHVPRWMSSCAHNLDVMSDQL